MKFHVAILSTISWRRQGSWKPIYTCPFSIAVGRFDWNSMWKISVKMQKRLWFFVGIGGVKSQLQGSKWNTRAVSKVFSHFEYLENRSRGLDVTWQSGETLLCIHEQSLSRGASQSAVRCRWLSLCTVWPSLGLVSRQETPLTEFLYSVSVFGATQSAVRRRWLSFCTVWTSLG